MKTNEANIRFEQTKSTAYNKQTYNNETHASGDQETQWTSSPVLLIYGGTQVDVIALDELQSHDLNAWVYSRAVEL